MSGRNAAAWVAAFAALVLLALQVIDTDGGSTSGGSGKPSNKNAGAASQSRQVKVIRAVDGDTILVRDGNGSTERVRLIGVDTPESVKPDTPVQCFGKEASDFTKHQLTGRTVRLEPDREPFDRYGRSLAFVYVGTDLFNADLLRGGYARTIEVPPNTSRAKQFAALERVAIRTNRGLWASCDR
jgi:micrococcal nuclease